MSSASHLQCISHRPQATLHDIPSNY